MNYWILGLGIAQAIFKIVSVIIFWSLGGPKTIEIPMSTLLGRSKGALKASPGFRAHENAHHFTGAPWRIVFVSAFAGIGFDLAYPGHGFWTIVIAWYAITTIHVFLEELLADAWAIFKVGPRTFLEELRESANPKIFLGFKAVQAPLWVVNLIGYPWRLVLQTMFRKPQEKGD